MTVCPKASNFSKDDVYKLGANIAKQLGYEPNGDINTAIIKAGGSIEYRDPLNFDDDCMDSGSVVIESVKNFKIYLSKYTSANRDRFTVAHELGHYVLHYFIKSRKEDQALGRMVCTRAGEGRVEWEANWFAAGFLMPEDLFLSIFHKESGDLDLVAERFGVSRSATEVRARVLRLLS